MIGRRLVVVALLHEINDHWTLGSMTLRHAMVCVLYLGLVPGLLCAKATLAPLSSRQQANVLFLSSLDPDLPDVAAMIEQAEIHILGGSEKPVHFSFEYLDLSSFASPDRGRATIGYLLEKYRGQAFDLVIVVNEQVFPLAEHIRARISPGAALLFFVVNPRDVENWLKQKTGTTGVIRKVNFLPTLQLALQQNPGTNKVVVVSGSSEAEKYDVQLAREQFRAYESNLEFQYLTDLQFSELGPRLEHLPARSVIVFLDFITDSRGEQFIPARILPMIAKTANRPIYGTFSSVVGAGVVGGSAADLGEVGRILGDDGARILKGEKPESIPVTTGDFQHYLIDWRELHRWGIPERQLPPGSVLLHWEYSPWELYRWKILGCCAVLLIETLLIGLLLRNIVRSKRAQIALTRKEKELAEAQRLARIGSWLWDASKDEISCSEELYRIHGLDPPLPPPRVGELLRLFTPESWESLTTAMKRVWESNLIQEVEVEAVRPDGSRRWVRIRGEAVRDATGRMIYLHGTTQDVTERKVSQAKLQESEDRLTAVVASAMDAIIAVDGQQRIVVFNASAEKMLRCPASEAIGGSIDRFIPLRFRAKHIEYLRRFGETKETSRTMGTLGALCALRSDGEEFPIEASISHVESGGRKLFTVIIRDITARRRAEEAAAESEKRFRLIANIAPVLIWMSGTDKLCNYFNQPWLEFTGRSFEEELGNGWTKGVHPEDLRKRLEVYTQYFDRRENFRMEYRLRHHDGEYRWVLDIGIPRFNSDGSFAGYVGCCMDISDVKKARATVIEFSGKLMRAGEEERARIARDLHDDINQRLALLANRIQECDEAMSANADLPQKNELREMWRLTNEIASDIQHISHQLHPSKLHYLGLGVTVRDLCREFSAQHKIEVECVVRDLPRDLDENVSLNLFRIVQESLRNVAKHSHARHAKLELTCHSDVVQLRVSDDGIGFAAEAIQSNPGLGLVSMRERLRSVGGEFSIWSKPSLGTQVQGTVPVIREVVDKETETGVA